MQREANDFAVVILAGGEATRFPEKLEANAGGIPLIVRVFRNVREMGPVYISANADFSPDVVAQLDATFVADDAPGRGPLAGLVSTFEKMAQPRAFVVAGDAPFVDAALLRRLLDAWQAEIEAVVAERSKRLEPLCALYNRAAFLAAGQEELKARASVNGAVKRLRYKTVPLADERLLASINTPADRDTLFGTRR